MKQIKGKCEFWVVPINIKNDGILEIPAFIDNKDEKIVLDEYYDKCISLKHIKENEACLFVDQTSWDGSSLDYSNPVEQGMKFGLTAKESLVSLLKANGCWTNEMIREYNKGNNFRDDPSPLEGAGITPDDFLIIKLK